MVTLVQYMLSITFIYFFNEAMKGLLCNDKLCSLLKKFHVFKKNRWHFGTSIFPWKAADYGHDWATELNWTEVKEKSDIIYSWQEKGLGDSQVPNSRSSLSVLREKISCGMSCEENIVYSQRLSVPGLREVSTSCHQCKPGKLFPFHTPGPTQTRLSQWEHRSGYLNPLLFLNPCIQVLSHLYTS